jgi:hypothetical protein
LYRPKRLGCAFAILQPITETKIWKMIMGMGMILRSLHHAGIVCVLIGWSLLSAHGQEPAKQLHEPLPEMWTKLESRLDSANTKVGDAIKVRVTQGWAYQGCEVAGGAILEGTVAEVVSWSKDSKLNEVSLGFTATCANQATIPVILMAVFSAGDEERSQMDIYNAMPSGIGPGASGRQSTNISAIPSAGSQSEELPLAKFGEVKGIRNLSLGVAKGLKQSTKLSSSSKRLRLEPGTRLAFVPVPGKLKAGAA